jgi:hypothetical protein
MGYGEGAGGSPFCGRPGVLTWYARGVFLGCAAR